MTIREFNAYLRGWIRANGGKEEATQDEYDEYFAALAEAHKAGLA